MGKKSLGTKDNIAMWLYRFTAGSVTTFLLLKELNQKEVENGFPRLSVPKN